MEQQEKTQNLEKDLNNTDAPSENLEQAAESESAAISETEMLQTQLTELNDKYLRLYSEFDNFKRRSAKERIELGLSAGKEIIQALLPILDDFERAKKSMANTQDLEAVKEGVNLIHQKLTNILEAKGLKSLSSVGQEFNVDFHEAITSIPAPTEDLKGKVVDEVERGYTLNEKVIRFAKVVIGE